MSLGFLKSITADVQLSDEEYVMNERRRFVPLSVSPFREFQLTGNSGEISTAGEVERPPEWLELAGDLAWTATFSSLTSNTAITEPIAVWNYAVFFGLTWHLWATQTTYDIKYYTNDWWHRALFASQLGIYAVLAAFSGSFTIGWEVSTETMEIFFGDATELTFEAMADNKVSSTIKSFQGVNLTLFVSRMLLTAQYLRVLWYRRRSEQRWSWRFCLQPASIFTAGCIFFGCFFLIGERPKSRSAAVTQLTLWVVAIALQVLGAALTPDDGEKVLKSQSALAPRLSTLTVIIMGEGLNGICGTLQHTMKSLGLTPAMVAQAVAMLLVLYFMWLLYFDGFRVTKSAKKSVSEPWLWFHFPLHLSLIMVLEGVKNVFIFVSLREATSNLGEAFGEVIDFYLDTNGTWPQHPWLEKLLLPLEMSWQQEMQDLVHAASLDPDELTAAVQVYRWFATVLHNVYLAANEASDPAAEWSFNYFISSNDTVVLNDLMGDQRMSWDFRTRYNILMEYSGHWLIAVSGTLLICMAILNIMRLPPRNRFAWGYSFDRIAIGSTLIVIGGATSNWFMKDHWWYWIIPTIAIGYSSASILDWLTLYRSILSISKQEINGDTKSNHSWVSNSGFGSALGASPGRIPRPYYLGVTLGSKGVAPSLYDQTYLASGPGWHAVRDAHASGEIFNPYAEAGVPSYPPYYPYMYHQDLGENSNDPMKQSLLGTNHENSD